DDDRVGAEHETVTAAARHVDRLLDRQAPGGRLGPLAGGRALLHLGSLHHEPVAGVAHEPSSPGRSRSEDETRRTRQNPTLRPSPASPGIGPNLSSYCWMFCVRTRARSFAWAGEVMMRACTFTSCLPGTRRPKST